MAVPVVGLTGGIASGKSTVARAFADRGVPVIDADQLAREVVSPGSEGLREIVETFGSDLLLPDGSLDRKALAALVFADPQRRMRLNAITHPRIGRLSAERIASVDPERHPFLIYEAALIVENGMHRGMHGLIVVSLDVPQQIERMVQRDGLSRDEAIKRIAAQAPLENKLAVADFVIDNGGPLTSLLSQVDDVHAQLLARVRGETR